MALRYYANAPATTLAVSCTAVATTIEVSSTTGLPISYPYVLIIDKDEATEEAVSVTNASGTTLTVTRGYDSTTAFAHSAAATVVHGITAADAREANVHVNETTGAHGITGDPVGTTDTQTLTNKDLSSGTNTFPSTLALDADLDTVAADLATHEADTTTHGATGAVVGTTNTQTLTNKTLTSPTINTPTITTPTITSSSAWSTWSPTLSNWTVGNGTFDATYYRVGRVIHFRVKFTNGSTTTESGQWQIDLPVNCLNTNEALGSAFITVAGASPQNYAGTAYANSASTIRVAMGLGSNLSNTTPGSWAAGDVVAITGSYEATS